MTQQSFLIDKQAESALSHFTVLDESMQKEIKAFMKYSAEKQMLLDIGALYGIFSLTFLARNKNASAFAIDPSPKSQFFLKLHKDLNPEFELKILSFAVGDRKKTQLMHFEWHHMVANAKISKNFFCEGFHHGLVFVEFIT